VVLERHTLLDCEGRSVWLEPGDVSVLPHKDAVGMRQDGSTFESLAIEWEPGTLGARPRGWQTCKLPRGALERLRSHVRAVSGTGPDTTDAMDTRAASSARFAIIVALLRSWGAPFERVEPGALVDDVPQHMAALSQALDGTLSRLAEGPSMLDLDRALGVTPRHLQRLVASFHERYGFNATTWRDALNRRRLLFGASMMTAGGSTTERVAVAMGYGSATAFCRALAQAGLPSPSAVPRIVRELA
jgi:AraC-like DNA-binding protein